jgi:hypothetical protein
MERSLPLPTLPFQPGFTSVVPEIVTVPVAVVKTTAVDAPVVGKQWAAVSTCRRSHNKAPEQPPTFGTPLKKESTGSPTPSAIVMAWTAPDANTAHAANSKPGRVLVRCTLVSICEMGDLTIRPSLQSERTR